MPVINRVSDKAARNLERAYRIKARSVSGSPAGPYRAIGSENELVTMQRPGVDTLDKMFKHAVTRFSHRHCLGTRLVVSEEDELQSNGKVLKKVGNTGFFFMLQYKSYH